MVEFTPHAKRAISMAVIAGTLCVSVQDPNSQQIELGRLVAAVMQSNSNTASVSMSTNYVTVQKTITDVDHDATPLKKPENSQGE